jgi:hypothetical protein
VKDPKQKVAHQTICCPTCGSTDVRREYLKRINIGCLLVNVVAFATLLETPNHFARACRQCGRKFVN